MPVGSFVTLLSLPLVLAGYADAVWAGERTRRARVAGILIALLVVRMLGGALPALSAVLAGLPAVFGFLVPPVTRLRRLGVVALPLLAAGGAVLGQMALLGPGTSAPPEVVVALTVAGGAAVLASDASSAFRLAALAALLAEALTEGRGLTAEAAFQTVWAASLLAGWGQLAVEGGVRVTATRSR